MIPGKVVGRLAPWLVTAALVASSAVPAQAAETRRVDGAARGENASVLPRVIGDRDAALYRRIFDLQKKGKWRSADREIKKLRSRLLMGHVQAQRYLHPTKYRSGYGELERWLRYYADHPEARRIYRLAMRRKGKSSRQPRVPTAPSPGSTACPRSPPPTATPRRAGAAPRRNRASARGSAPFDGMPMPGG